MSDVILVLVNGLPQVNLHILGTDIIVQKWLYVHDTDICNTLNVIIVAYCGYCSS